jgi:predicted AAA+ superfamily ATPase
MNKNNLIERKQYMQILRNMKDQNIIKVTMLKSAPLLDFLYHGGIPYSIELGENEQSKAFLKSVLDAIVEKDGDILAAIY